MHELYERVTEVLRLPSGSIPLRASLGVEAHLDVAQTGTTLEAMDIADVASALEGLGELRDWFCGERAGAEVGDRVFGRGCIGVIFPRHWLPPCMGANSQRMPGVHGDIVLSKD